MERENEDKKQGRCNTKADTLQRGSEGLRRSVILKMTLAQFQAGEQ